MSAATATILTIGTIAATSGVATASIVSAHKQSNAAKEAAKTSADAQTSAAKLTTDAANHAADLGSKDNQAALAYTKQQADQTQANFATTQRANYDQWVSAQRRLGSLGQLVGLGARDIPDFVPPTTLGAAPPPTTAPAGAGSASGPTGATSANAAVPGGDYQSWFNGLVAGKPYNQETLSALEPTLNAAGVKLTPPNQAGDRTKIQLPSGEWVRVGFGEGKPVWIPQGGATSTSAASTTPAYGASLATRLPTLGAGLQAPATAPIGGTLALPTPLAVPGTLADYLAMTRRA